VSGQRRLTGVIGNLRPASAQTNENGPDMRAYLTGKTFARRTFAVALGAGCAALLAGAAQAADFKVAMNETKALHLATPASTIIVGNPAIADVSVEGSKLLYVVGRSYGTTNFIALDGEGKTIMDMDVSVVSQSASAVTLTRGTGQLSYNCTPRCERVPVIGDDSESYNTIMQQTAGTVGAGTVGNTGGAASEGTE
jgi:Flp pilus assembly secretin CpaC